MKIDQITTTADIENFIEGCLNDFETGISTKSETMTSLCELVGHVYVNAKSSELPPCDVCGSTDVIDVPHMGKNCNTCHPLITTNER